MYPGLPSRLEKDIKDRYLSEILKGDKRKRCRNKLHIPLLKSQSVLIIIFLLFHCSYLHLKISMHSSIYFEDILII